MEDDRTPPLGHLRRDEPPQRELRDRVQRSLEARRLLQRRRWVRVGWAMAAGIAGLSLFAGGLALGGRSSTPVAEGQRYALLLYDPAGFDRTVPEASLVDEYRGWAESLGQRLAMGEKLGPEERLLGQGGPQPTMTSGDRLGPLGGLFIVRAGSWEEAMAIARTCPHLRHGGAIAVRRIEET